MGDCDCAVCDACKDAAGENAMELYRLRLLVDELCGIVGTGIRVPEKFRPQVIWDMTEWVRKAVAAQHKGAEQKEK